MNIHLHHYFVSFLKRFFFVLSSRRLLLLGVFILTILTFAIRGLPGNPTAEDIMATEKWRASGPLELSPERGRFSLLYSVVEDGTLLFSTPVARIATPDLGINPDGRFVSLFAPFLSFLLIPGYFIGKLLGASVVGATATVAVFALGNALLILSISRYLGSGLAAAFLGAAAFLFGTPAFAYATTIYQHHVSAFLMLLSLWILLRSRSFAALSAVSFMFGFSIALDNPNAILFIPILFFAVFRAFPSIRTTEGIRNITIRPILVLSAVFAVIPIALFMWYNSSVNGDSSRLSGTLPSVPAISISGQPLDRDPDQKTDTPSEDPSSKTVVGFFETRRLLNGFIIHLFSPDRGTIRYAPVIFLGIFGWAMLFRERKTAVANVLVGVALTTLLLYSLWGDPWGGWAFGSRYLIPAYAMLGIGISIALESWRRSRAFLSVFAVLFLVSVSVNTLGAITSSANPPQSQVLALEALSGKEEKYTIARNWQYLEENGSKAFLYQVWASDFMSAESYYWSIVTAIALGSSVPFAVLWRRRKRMLSL